MIKQIFVQLRNHGLHFTMVILALTLSSCAGDTALTLFPDLSQPERLVGERSEISPLETEDNDVDLEEIEPQMCLQEELTALSRTGIWSEESSPVTASPPSKITYDFPVVLNKQVEMYLNLFQTKQRKQFSRWLAKSGYYREMIENELEIAGLPKDLLYLSMIESGFNQMAYSRAKAVGLWQFMKATGRQYNLRVDKYIDERRDALKSTKAAVAYLGDLYREFGDWHLAVAAYNGGPGKIRGGLRKYKVDNFWDLASKRYLRLETKRYVPKLIATLLIARQPEKYGFFGITYKESLRYDTISVGPGLSFDAIALISNSNAKTIKNLNLELRQRKTPPNNGRYNVNIPYGTKSLAQKNISRLHSIVSTGYKSHKIRKGESLSKICSRYGINKTTLLKVNNLRTSKLIVGTNLRIPYSTVTYKLLQEGSGAMAAYRDSLVLHHIKPGDTVSGVAKRYNVPPEMIVAWNGLKSVHSIRAGQQLALYIQQTKPSSTVAVKSKGTKAGTTVSASLLKANKVKRRPSKTDPSFQWYSVKNGDSLWTISRKFSASTDDIKKWNNLKSNLIHPGIRLKLKKV
ncbi:MAG: LysM peptidoglycan-binding domain-containing protein [Desulforhopalus sp.]